MNIADSYKYIGTIIDDDTPPVTAVAKDGIQLIAKARVTVRANIKQLVGGAGVRDRVDEKAKCAATVIS